MSEWNPQDLLNAEKRTAMAHIEALTAEFDDIVAGTTDGNSDDEHDPEGSTLAFERARVAALLGQERAYLAELERAGQPRRRWHLRNLRSSAGLHSRPNASRHGRQPVRACSADLLGVRRPARRDQSVAPASPARRTLRERLAETATAPSGAGRAERVVELPAQPLNRPLEPRRYVPRSPCADPRVEDFTDPSQPSPA